MGLPRKPSNDHAQTTAEDLRQWGRYPTGEVDILVPSDRGILPGVVVDESIGGIGIRINEIPELIIGQAMKLEYHGVEMPGYVTSIRRQTDHYRLGVCWIDAPDALARFRYEASFFVFKGVSVACQVVETLPANTASVVLWDGAAFQIPADRLQLRTVKQRKSDLAQSPEKIAMLAGLYGFSDLEAAVTVDTVLDLEFADLRTRRQADTSAS